MNWRSEGKVYRWLIGSAAVATVTGLSIRELVERLPADSEAAQGQVIPSASLDVRADNDAASPSGPDSTLSTPEEIAVRIVTDPSGAELFLDWQSHGFTPQRLSRPEIPRLLVVAKPGYRPSYMYLDAQSDPTVQFLLQPDTMLSEASPVILLSGEATDLLSDLSVAAEAIGFVFRAAPMELLREIQRAGEPSHSGIMAWARAKYDARYLIEVRVVQDIRELSQEDLPDARLRQALSGTYKATANIEANVLDLQRRQFLGAVRGFGTGTGLDRDRAWERARRNAAAQFVRQLEVRVENGQLVND